MIKKLILFCLFAVLTNSVILCQEVRTSVHADKNSIVIGDQVKLTVSVTTPPEYLVNFPIFKDSLNSGIEIVSIAAVDTVLSQDKKSRTLNQTYTLTIFDSGFYYVKPFDIQLKKPKESGFSSVLTDSLCIKVHTIQVDTTKAIKDIKSPLRAPLTFIEIVEYLGILAGIALVILAVLYVIYKVKRKEPLIKFPEKPKPPSHLIALQELEALRIKKLWQSGHVKEYYSQLTDILRTYIEKRYLFKAMEMVTDEIIEEFKSTDLDEELRRKVDRMLKLADIVKFAKGEPLPDENETCLNDAVYFVKSTVPVENNQEVSGEEMNKDNVVK